MKWIDYREKLGIGICDNQKYSMLLNKICTFVETIIGDDYDRSIHAYYCIVTGEPYREDATAFYYLQDSFKRTDSIEELIAKYIAFYNVQNDARKNVYIEIPSKDVLMFIEECLDDLNIPFEIFKDEDGSFIFPKGAKELDNALVSEPLEWLNKYPNARKEWVEALKDYSNMSKTNPSDVADKFRKALERFFQDFFKSTKSLENLKSEYGTYVKSKGVPTEIGGNFETVLQSYSNFMNNYAKHHNKTSENVLEYIMYQTGNIIRLLITLENNY